MSYNFVRGSIAVASLVAEISLVNKLLAPNLSASHDWILFVLVHVLTSLMMLVSH